MDWKGIWEIIKNFFIENGWNILWFFGILLLGIVIIKILLNITRSILNKTRMEKIAEQFVLGLIKFFLYMVLILILLSVIGVQISGIVTALSAILLAVGLALEDNISNFANGLIIVSTHMFSKGDYVIVDEVEGSITNINFLFTTLITTDNKRITIPNNTIVNEAVTNFGANTTRRVQYSFFVAHESDVELVKKVIIDVMKSNGKVYLDEPIFCRLKNITASGLEFFSYCWVDKEDYWDVYYYLLENVYNEFKRNNINISVSQMEIRNRKEIESLPLVGDAIPERVEKIRVKNETFDLETVDFSKLFKYKLTQMKTKTKKTKSRSKSKGSTDGMDKAIESSIAGKEVDKNYKKVETKK